jgi:hypothetical protein
MLHELVKLVHIHVHQQLRGEVPERESDIGTRLETADYFSKKTHNIFVGDIVSDDL